MGEERRWGEWRGEGRRKGVERRREEGMDRREAERGGCSKEGRRDAGLRKRDGVVEGGASETEGGSSEGEKGKHRGRGGGGVSLFAINSGSKNLQSGSGPPQRGHL